MTKRSTGATDDVAARGAITRSHAPGGARIYAVGDIHGCADLLSQLLEKIRLDAAQSPSQKQWLIFLGDYIDRGPDSKGVVDVLLSLPETFPNTVFLKGNHEVLLTSALESNDALSHWTRNGGVATLASYGVSETSLQRGRLDSARLTLELEEKMPLSHMQFFSGLETSATLGDYFFVHAGVRPGVPLDRQDEDDLCWIRSEFLDYQGDFGKVIVHGHTPADEPENKRNRIGIDTGAVFTGVLTAVVLEGPERRFLHASKAASERGR